MAFLNALATLFLLPGTLVLSSVGLNNEEDGGIFRSLINMIFWGFVVMLVSLPFILSQRGA